MRRIVAKWRKELGYGFRGWPEWDQFSDRRLSSSASASELDYL
jgi:hypothetical protein